MLTEGVWQRFGACSSLTHLSICFKGQPLSHGLRVHPQLLAQALPHVTHLTCSIHYSNEGHEATAEDVAVLVHGLGPQLVFLNACLDGYIPEGLAAAVASCSQLRSISIREPNQAVLDAIALLPSLTHVVLTGFVSVTRQCPPPKSVWQELDLSWTLNCRSQVLDLARLPLKHVQRLVLDGMLSCGLIFCVPGPGTWGRAAWDEVRQAVREIGSIPDVQWDEWLRLEVPTPDSLQVEGETVEGLVAASQAQLHQSIAVLAPFACKGLKIVWLDIGSPYGRMCGETVAALGTAFGAAMTKLDITLQTPTIAVSGQSPVYSSICPSFWAALGLGSLPRLESMRLHIQDTGDHDMMSKPELLSRLAPEGLQRMVAESRQHLSIGLYWWHPLDVAMHDINVTMDAFKERLRAIRRLDGSQSLVEVLD